MAKVFISYQSEDQALAFEICDYLEAQGLSCWIAPRDIHAGEYAGEITRALKSVEFLVLVCSKCTSRSTHVKNEVSLSFEHGCRIVPFFRESAILDDSLKYFLAGKQRVYMDKDKEESFAKLYTVLTGKQADSSAHIPATKKNGHKALKTIPVLTAVLFVAVAAIYHFATRQAVPKSEPTAPADTSAVAIAEEVKEASEITEPSLVRQDAVVTTTSQQAKSQSAAIATNADTFSGKLTGGRPDGVGTYTFRKARRIDMHDDKAREATAGDYITGEWDNGHLIQGKWYGADGTVKGTIILGKAGDPEKDHIFEKCTR